MIVLLALISFLTSNQSLKFSLVETGALVGGVLTGEEKIKKKNFLSFLREKKNKRMA